MRINGSVAAVPVRRKAMSKRDYYEVLSVAKDVDGEALKKAYRTQALKNHPDRNPGDAAAEDRFKEAAEAYEVLSNAQKRAVYDRYGHEGLSGGVGMGGAQDVFSQFQDIFGDFFGFGGGRGGGRRAHGPQPGADLRTTISLSLQDVVRGVKQEIALEYPGPCGDCDGSGSKSGKRALCSMCRGSGQVSQARGSFLFATTCPQCHGTGSSVSDPCSTCRGAGETKQQRTVTVTIPAGIDDGQSLRLTSQGQPGRQGAPPGHLYVTARVQPDEVYERDGYDLIYPLSLSFPQAALGATVDVPTLTEEEFLSLDVPAGVQPGQPLTLRKKGIPHVDGRRRGDFIAVVQVEVPKKLSSKAKKLVRELENAL